MATGDDDKIERDADRRAPYEAPTLECEELFEVLALTCGKINPNSVGCITVPKVS